MAIPLRVLMVEDSENDTDLILRQLHRAGYDVEFQRVETARDMQNALTSRPWEIVTVDYSLPEFDAPSALALMQKSGLDIPIIVISGEVTEEMAVALMRAGAQDYLRKDNLARLAPVLERELIQARKRQEHKIAENAVRSSEERYRSLVEQASEGIFILDAAGNYLEVNPRGCELLGYSREELLKMNMQEFLLEEDLVKWPINFKELYSGLVSNSQRRIRHKDGRILLVEISAIMMSDGRLQGIVRDVTERKKSEDELKRLNRVYALTSQVNQMMVHTRDAMELFANVCRIAIREGNFRMAWVGLLDEHHQMVRPVSWFGEERGYLNVLKELQVAEGPGGQGPTSKAVRSGKPVASNDIASDPGMEKTRAEALARGYQSLLALPLIVRGKVVGVFVLYAGEPFFFNQAEFRLLEGVTGDIAYALEMFENEKQRITVEERLQDTLQQLNFHVENSPLAVVQLDGDFKITSWSGRAEEMFGWKADEVIGRHLEQTGWFSGQDVFLIKSQDVLQPRSIMTFRNYRKNGSAIICQWYNSALLTPGGELISLSSQILDISEQERAADALKASEEKFRLLVEQSPSGILILNPEGKVIEWNRAQEKITRLKRSEVMGRFGWEVQHQLLPENRRQPERVQRNKEFILELLRSGQSPHLNTLNEHEIRCGDGNLNWIESTAFVIETANGNNSVTISNDISRRKQVEAALKANAAQLDLVFNSTSDAQILFKVEGNDRYTIQMVNQACYQQVHGNFPDAPNLLVGMERKEYLQALGVAQNEIDLGLPMYNDLLKNLEAVQYESTISSRLGSVLLEVTLTPVLNPDGRCGHILWTARNITERKRFQNSLRESNERFSNAFEFAPNGMAMTTLDGHWLKVNRALCEMVGYSEQELLAMSYHEITHPDDIAENVALNRRLIAGEFKSYQMQKRYFHKTGRLIWVMLSSSLVRDNQGKALYTISQIVNITGLKQAEETLRLQSAALEHVANAIIIMDTNWRIQWANPAWTTLTGFSFDESVGHTPDLIRSGVHEPAFYQAIEATLSRGEVWQGELVNKRKDGSLYTEFIILTPVLDTTGEVSHYVAVKQDISERKNAEAALQRSEAGLRQAQRIAQTGSWEWDMLANKVSWSDEMFRVFDIDPDTYDGSPEIPLKVIHPDDVDDYVKSMKSNQETGSSPTLEYRVVHRDGSIHHVYASGQLIFDAAGRPVRAIGTVQDITSRKLVEEELRQAHAELEKRVLERTAELQLANQALEKAARMKDEFLASMSHELRTPLTGILGLSEALQMVTYGDLNEKQRHALKNIEISGRHLLTLINDILDLSKIEAGKFDLQIDNCSLGEICQASLQLTKGMANQKHQKVSFQMDPASIVLKADARRLKQMIVNLLGNAIKFTAEGGSLGIEVQGFVEKEELRITVWDEGIGIQSADMARLFKPFVQLDSSLSRQYAGTGLGLSLVQRLAVLHDGRVEVESTPEIGSRFTIVLPWHEVTPALVTNSQRATGPLVLAVEKPQFGPRVLVVDDNDIVLELVSDFLRSRNYQVNTARDGQEFFEKLAQQPVEVILMDIQMPGMDGIEVIRRIRAHAQARIAGLPVIAVTALAMPGDRERCLAAGANDYLSKPIQLSDLANKIQTLLGQSRPAGSAASLDGQDAQE